MNAPLPPLSALAAINRGIFEFSCNILFCSNTLSAGPGLYLTAPNLYFSNEFFKYSSSVEDPIFINSCPIFSSIVIDSRVSSTHDIPSSSK